MIKLSERYERKFTFIGNEVLSTEHLFHALRFWPSRLDLFVQVHQQKSSTKLARAFSNERKALAFVGWDPRHIDSWVKSKWPRGGNVAETSKGSTFSIDAWLLRIKPQICASLTHHSVKTKDLAMALAIHVSLSQHGDRQSELASKGLANLHLGILL